MSILNYLILFTFQVCFLAEIIDQEKKEYHNQIQTFSIKEQEFSNSSLNRQKTSNPKKNPKRRNPRALSFNKCIVRKENAKGFKADFSILDLKFGAEIADVDHLKDEAKKFKTLLDFVMASIAKNDIDEFRLIMDLNDQKIFVVPYSTTNSANKRQEYVSGGDSLTIKLQNLLANRSSTFEFLYYINQNSDADEIWMGGVWSRGPRSNKISKNDPALKMIVTAFDKNTRSKNNIDVKSTDSNDFKKDIMEMWSNWNDGQKHNYCYGILKALHSMGIKKSPGLYLKWNRGRKSGTQSQELNHVHVILEEKEDLEKMNLLLYEYRNKLEEEKFLPQKWLSSLNTNSLFSANEEDFI